MGGHDKVLCCGVVGQVWGMRVDWGWGMWVGWRWACKEKRRHCGCLKNCCQKRRRKGLVKEVKVNCPKQQHPNVVVCGVVWHGME